MARLISPVLFVFLIFSSAASAQEGLFVPLHGRVRSLLTESFQSSDDPKGELRRTFSDYQVFDALGNTLESVSRGPDGRVISHTLVTLGDANKVLRVTQYSDGPDGTTTDQNVYDEQGQIVEQVAYDKSGQVTRRLKHEKDQNTGYSTMELIPSGHPAIRMNYSEEKDPETGETIYTIITDGKPERETRMKEDASGNLRMTVVDFPTGYSAQLDRKADGTQTEKVYRPADRSWTFKTTDSQGRVLSFVTESGSSRAHCEYRYDEEGRLVELMEYGSSDEVIGKETTEYRDDPGHNWIEQKWTRWDMLVVPPKPTLILLNRRTIDYYE